MTATSLQTTYNNQDVADTVIITSIGGGPGAGSDPNIYVQGDESVSRRINNQTRGWVIASDDTTDRNLSGLHLKIWVGSVTWPDVTSVDIIIDDGTNIADQHTIDTTLFPPAGGIGFIPIHLDPNRTPETGGTTDITAIGATEGIGIEATVGSLSSNLDNMFTDSITYGSAGYALTAAANIAQVATAEAVITTGKRGILLEQDGIYFCYSRLVIGSSSHPTLTSVSTQYSDTNETIVFPNQTLVATDYMGLTHDLGNAATTVSYTGVTIQSANVSGASRRPDFVVSNTSGSLTLTSSNLLGMRLITLNSACSVTGGILDAIEITQGSADIENLTINTRSTANVAVIDDPTFGVSTDLNNVEFIQEGTGHAIEITAAGTYTFTNLTFTGYSGTAGENLTGNSGSSAAAILNSSNGDVTIIVSGGDVPSIRNSGASSRTFVQNNATVSLTRLLGNTEISVLDNPSPYSATTLPAPAISTVTSTERVSADTNTGNGSTDYIQYINNSGFLQINALGLGTNFNNFPGVLQDTSATNPRVLSAGDKVRVTIRDDADNPSLQLFDEFEVSGTPSSASILTTTSFSGFTSAFGTTLNSANSKTVTVEKVDARFQFSTPVGNVVDILAFRTGSDPVLSLENTAETGNLPLTQVGDRNYRDPA